MAIVSIVGVKTCRVIVGMMTKGDRMKTRKKITPIFPFTISVAGSQYQTSASSESAAISKAAYRYAMDNGMDVRLVQWKIRNKEIEVKII
jgi:hypothetical protein